MSLSVKEKIHLLGIKRLTDGWVPGKNLFPILKKLVEKGTFICYLLSDAAQMQLWPTVKKYLTAGKTLYFSHGFAVTYHDKTNVTATEGY